MEPPDDPFDWSIDQVVQNLCDGVKHSATPEALQALEAKLRDNDIDGEILLTTITMQMLKEDFEISSLGFRGKILRYIKKLQRQSHKWADDPDTIINNSYPASQYLGSPRTQYVSSASSPVLPFADIPGRHDLPMGSSRAMTPILNHLGLGRLSVQSDVSERSSTPQHMEGDGKSRRINSPTRDTEDHKTSLVDNQPVKKVKRIQPLALEGGNAGILKSSVEKAARHTEKITVDDIFFGKTKLGGDIPDQYTSNPKDGWLEDDDDNFTIVSTNKIPPAKRALAHHAMRHFLRDNKRWSNLHVRDGEEALAIVPYTTKFQANTRQSPSFLLYRESANGFTRTREKLSRYPALENQFFKAHTATRPSTRKGLASTLSKSTASKEEPGDWDFLDKYLIADDVDNITLPKYGDSGSEGEYDDELMKEIEEEQEEQRQRRSMGLERIKLSPEEVEKTIEDVLSKMAERWHATKRPKKEAAAYSLWVNSRRYGYKQSLIRTAERQAHYLQSRLARLRADIASDEWYSHSQLRKQCECLEATVNEREELLWRQSMLQSNTRPEKPQIKKRHRLYQKTAPKIQDDDEETLDSDSEDDFIVQDESEIENSPMAIDDIENVIEEDDAEMPDVMVLSDNRSSPTSASNAETTSEETKITKQVKCNNPFSDDHKDAPTMYQDSGSLGDVNKSKLSTVLKKLKREHYHLKYPKEADSEPNQHSDDHPEPSHSPVSQLETTQKNEAEMPLSQKSSKHPTPPLGRATKSGAGHSSALFSSILVRTRSSSPLSVSSTPIEKKAEAPTSAHGSNDIVKHLILNMISKLSSLERQLLQQYMNDVSEESFVRDITRGLRLMSHHTSHAQFSRSEENTVLKTTLMLFLSYHFHKHYKLSTVVPPEDVDKILKDGDNISKFFAFLKACLNYYGLVQRVLDSDKTKPEQSQKKRKLSKASSISEEDSEMDAPNSITPHKKRKREVKINQAAHEVRMNDKDRVEEQEMRKGKLMKSLAEKGYDGTDPQHIIVNPGKKDDEDPIYLNAEIASRIKPHQVEGVRFMWREVIMNGDNKGCLLAHTMGLGKTMQVITLLVTIAETALDPELKDQIPERLRKFCTLILCPSTLVENWYDEFLIWTPQTPEKVFGHLRAVYAKMSKDQRIKEITQWASQGGILIIGYDLFRGYISDQEVLIQKPFETNDSLVEKWLLENPTIIVADEAHKMKNKSSKIAKATAKFKCGSRIALTGTPLSNNLEEYYAMVNWIAPGYLGKPEEFNARYVEPIQEGLYEDSSRWEQRMSLIRLKALHQDLAPKLNRADITVLKNDMPPKTEFLITVPLTDLQRNLYTIYVDSIVNKKDYSNAGIFACLSRLQLICNHPLCFKREIIDRAAKQTRSSIIDDFNGDDNDQDTATPEISSSVIPMDDTSKVRCEEAFHTATATLYEDDPVFSYKVVVLQEILELSAIAKEKVLVFSLSITTLDYLEELLRKKGFSFMRLDGSTTISKRQNEIKAFNSGDCQVYLISTRAGGQGLNIAGANRVVIFDFGFSPTWEEQAVGRAYRIGQTKPVFVYRLLSGGSFEQSIHNRAIFKTQLFSRVVDKKSITRHANKGRLHKLIFRPHPVNLCDLTEYIDKDPLVLKRILSSTPRKIIKIDLTETFQKEITEELTKEEQAEADQMLSDERLRRTDPVKWELVRSRRGFEVRSLPETNERINGPNPSPFGVMVPHNPQMPLQVSRGAMISQPPQPMAPGSFQIPANLPPHLVPYVQQLGHRPTNQIGFRNQMPMNSSYYAPYPTFQNQQQQMQTTYPPIVQNASMNNPPAIDYQVAKLQQRAEAEKLFGDVSDILSLPEAPSIPQMPLPNINRIMNSNTLASSNGDGNRDAYPVQTNTEQPKSNAFSNSPVISLPPIIPQGSRVGIRPYRVGGADGTTTERPTFNEQAQPLFHLQPLQQTLPPQNALMNNQTPQLFHLNQPPQVQHAQRPGVNGRLPSELQPAEIFTGNATAPPLIDLSMSPRIQPTRDLGVNKEPVVIDLSSPSGSIDGQHTQAKEGLVESQRPYDINELAERLKRDIPQEGINFESFISRVKNLLGEGIHLSLSENVKLISQIGRFDKQTQMVIPLNRVPSRSTPARF